MKWEPKNPNNVDFWVGKLINIPNSILSWSWLDLNEDENNFSRTFKNQKEFETWRDQMAQYPVFVDYVDSDGDGTASGAYYCFVLADGTTMECGMHIDYQVSFSSDGWDEELQLEFDKWDKWQKLEKQRNENQPK